MRSSRFSSIVVFTFSFSVASFQRKRAVYRVKICVSWIVVVLGGVWFSVGQVKRKFPEKKKNKKNKKKIKKVLHNILKLVLQINPNAPLILS